MTTPWCCCRSDVRSCSSWSELRTGWISAHIFPAFTLSPHFCGFKLRFSRLFRQSCLPCTSPSATRRSGKGSIARDVARGDGHGHTLERFCLQNQHVFTQTASDEGCHPPAQGAEMLMLLQVVPYQVFGDLGSCAMYRACLWVCSSKVLHFPASNIPWFLNETNSNFLLLRSDRRQIRHKNAGADN